MSAGSGTPTANGKELTPDENGVFTYEHPTGNKVVMFPDGNQEIHHKSGLLSKIQPCGKAETFDQSGSLIHSAVSGSKFTITGEGEIKFS